MFLDIAIELVVGFLSLLVVLKVLGKIQFSQVTPFDFITAMVMGNLVGDAIFSVKAGIKEIIFSVVIWGILIYLVEFTTQKSILLRKFFEGTPSILINKGEIIYKQLKKNNIDLNQLQQLMRKQGYFSIYEAEYVILERDGQISIAPKFQYQLPTTQDLQIPPKKVALSYAIIMDGKVQMQNLTLAGLDENWLLNQLKQHNVDNYSEVFFGEWQQNRGLLISKYK
ncbi:DUF421 domain-containing protein [Bacillus sp. B1-b2]|uniref:DUF421 domain-containing protein n=1 Tax=Bacillus sp. B1-b2 TaxID=2653201 RepID=UPI0012623DB6|nr:DUF421 domain-containing protein [Bacillus sp. B1-b2]KAB7671249.1 DUF421 domain-containing protein [Bacillus sp. B1-b2]